MTQAGRSMVRLEAEGQDADEATALLSGLYDGSGWRASAGPDGYRYRHAALGDDAMTFRTTHVTGTMQGVVPANDEYVVQWLVGGRGSMDGIDLGPQQLMLFVPNRPFPFRFDDFDERLVHLRRDVVHRMAEERGLLRPDEVARFDHTAPPAADAGALWFDTVGLVSRTLQRGAVNDLLWGELTRMTAAAFLELYPVHADPDQRGAVSGRDVRIRAAVEFVHHHAASPITPEDVAAAVGVSVRALQVAFQRSLAQSPAAYIRQVRLDRAHEQLRLAHPSATTVALVARSWGFAHLGRFSAQYRERFGVPPSETLRR